MPIVPQAGGLIMGAIACRRRAGGRQPGGTPVAASPYVIRLDDAGRAELEAVSRRATATFRLVQRARIVLLAAGGPENRGLVQYYLLAGRHHRGGQEVALKLPLGHCLPKARKVKGTIACQESSGRFGGNVSGQHHH
jgi:hypothetical protein